MQCIEPPAGAAYPSGKRRALQLDSLTREHLRLAIKRQMIAIFADQDMGEQRRCCEPASDHPFGRRHLRHRLRLPAGIFGTPDADYAQGRQQPLEHFTDAFADRMAHATATVTAFALNVELPILAL